MNVETLISELTFKAVRSSGAGGQHVNKVSSKVMLTFNVSKSQGLSEEEKEILLKRLASKLTKEHLLILNSDESRSQHKNKEFVIKRFISLIQEGLVIPKERIPTKIPKAVIKKRLDDKRKQSGKKADRKKPDLDN
ncbi:MAG: aminoacyl-tRNA hydrolase [Flavobacteriaceae bacterium]|nr:aminoacyl-tRNA hydrolase [Flavobacteriaceae bacterium]